MTEHQPIHKESGKDTSGKFNSEVAFHQSLSQTKTTVKTYSVVPEDISWYKKLREVREVFHI